jgi:hypothetical protein
MMPVFPALAISAVVLVVDQVPTLNFTPSCRASAAGVAGLRTDFEACARTEREARDQLAKQWREFPAADRESCTRLTRIGGTGGTYTELITCLEMKRDVRTLPKTDDNVGRVAR